MVFLSIALLTALTGMRVSTAASAAVKSGCSCVVIADPAIYSPIGEYICPFLPVFKGQSSVRRVVQKTKSVGRPQRRDRRLARKRGRRTAGDRDRDRSVPGPISLALLRRVTRGTRGL